MSGPGEGVGALELPNNFAFNLPANLAPTAFANSTPPTSPAPTAATPGGENAALTPAQREARQDTSEQKVLDRLNAKEDTIDTKFGENSPQDKRIDSRIARVQARFAARPS